MKTGTKIGIVAIIWFSLILPILMLTVCVIFLSGRGCAADDFAAIMSDGFFQYIVVTEYDRVPTTDNEEVIAIIEWPGNTEVIEIPMEIDGKPVRYIGYRDEGFWHYNSYWVHRGNLEKMYIHDNIEKMEYFEGAEVEVMVCSNSVNIRGGAFKKIYIYKSLFDGANYSSNFSPANIVFMNNYSDEVNGGYYRLDNIEAGEKIPEVPEPEREGYEFGGWYTEPECVNVWDFDVAPTIEEDTEFRLYAGWKMK